ncbi:unnamed protein product [Chironomus riparius]|uniref:Ionotropic receptor n=1 Tax=Chironomus riparius TaxID=315576 RepID=A0A9N9S5B3_9DIPT|nr:unnamed protein product [Chironomus riparius]
MCNKPVAVVKDTFNLATRKWEFNLTADFEKFHNFQNCDLKIGFDPEFRELGRKDELDREIKGIFVSLFNIIGEKGNFIPRPIIFQQNESYPLRSHANFASGIDIYSDVKSLLVPTHHVTTTFDQIDMIFKVTPSEKYTNFEKMALPFDDATWVLLLVTFFIAFSVIFMVNQLPMKFQEIMYGSEVKMPAFNIIGTFFGISQTRLPTSNFPRMILAFFVYFCLVIRTAYQGVAYDMLTNDIRRPKISQLVDLYAGNYTIYTLNQTNFVVPLRNMIDGSKKIQIKVFDSMTRFQRSFCQNINDSSKKIAYFVPHTAATEYDFECKSAGHQLDQILYSTHIGYAVYRNNFIYDLLQNVTQQLIPAGIPQHLAKLNQWIIFKSHKEIAYKSPSVLTIDDLRTGFLLWMVACCITIGVFVIINLNGVLMQYEEYSTTQSFIDVIHELYIKSQITFDVIFIGYSSNDFEIEIDDILKSIEEKVLIGSIYFVTYNNVKIYSLNQSAILFFKSYQDLNFFNSNARLTNRYPKKLAFLIHVEILTRPEFLVKLTNPVQLDPDVGHISLYQYFLVQNYTTMYLMTFEWFTPRQCNIHQGIKIDEFDMITQKWKWNLNYQFVKFKNFHGCLLVTGSEDGFQDMAYIDSLDLKTKGFIVDYTRIIAENGNFTAYHRFLKSNLKSDINSANQGLLVNIFPQFKSMTLNELHLTTVFEQSDMIFLITPSEKYSNFEKMAMPFDLSTWILLFTTFSIAFTVIFIVNQMSRSIQNIVYGINVKMPAFNMIGTFFGISQFKLPKSNFSRMILINFVYFCLIIRTAYQGVFYDMFTTDIRKPSIKTIKQVYENNFTIVALALDDYVRPLYTFSETNVRPRIIQFKTDFEIMIFYCQQIQNSSAKLAFFLPHTELDELYSKCKVRGRKLRQNLYSNYLALGVLRNNFIYHLMQDVIDQLIPSGIPQYLIKFYDWIHSRDKRFIFVKIPKVLTLKDLEFGFLCWAAACSTSTAIFLIEIVYKFCLKFEERECTTLAAAVKKRERKRSLTLDNYPLSMDVMEVIGK